MWRSLICLFGLVIAAGACGPAAKHQTPGSTGTIEFSTRLEQLIQANIAATHAYQTLLARKTTGSNASCYPQEVPAAAVLEGLVAHQEKLLATPPDALKNWVSAQPSTFDPSKDLEPLLRAELGMPKNLPVNVFSSYLRQQVPKAPQTSIRAIASLYQMDLEQERDGDGLQDLFRFYIALGLPVYVGQLGLPGTDEDFLSAARELAGRSCASPFELSSADWQIAGRKIWNWGEKLLHIRDAGVVAGEWLDEIDVRAEIPAMRAMPPQKIAVIGHSFTMDVHWASPSAFVPIVTAMFARENPRVEFRQFQAGGLTSSRAYKNFYQDALAWKPAIVLLVLVNRTPQDLLDLKTMAQGFRAENIRVFVFDNVLDANDATPETRKESLAIVREAGATVVPVSRVFAPGDREKFLCLDHIHMKEPYHRIMAREWLKVILAANANPVAQVRQ